MLILEDWRKKLFAGKVYCYKSYFTSPKCSILGCSIFHIYIPTFTYVNVMGIYGSYKVHLRLIPVVRAWVDNLVLWKVQVKYYYSPPIVYNKWKVHKRCQANLSTENCVLCARTNKTNYKWFHCSLKKLKLLIICMCNIWWNSQFKFMIASRHLVCHFL